MKNLEHYTANYNSFRAIFKEGPLDIHNPTDLRRIAGRVESDLSPENLTMDGELPGAEVKARHAYLIAVARDIKRLDPSIRFWELDHV